jgi:hypothetical protein
MNAYEWTVARAPLGLGAIKKRVRSHIMDGNFDYSNGKYKFEQELFAV